MFNQGTWETERNRLQRVIEEIAVQLNISENAALNFKKETISIQKRMWEDVLCAPQDVKDLDVVAQSWHYQVEVASEAQKFKSAYKALGKLQRMYLSPYFGRMDFAEDNDERPEEIYIGIHNLIHRESGEILVYDWRAPISSLYYDYEVGRGSYLCPGGTVKGDILLKRQYKIENQELAYMFDSSIKINDELLQQVLSKGVDTKMRTIVTSIQREQNSVIRNDDHNIVIVQGPAGSGKTSIALHRAAYILYRHRDTMGVENIMIFSPNQIFNSYISNVLPELGEDNLNQTTFQDYFSNIYKTDKIREGIYNQIEFILAPNDSQQYNLRTKSIKYKSSTAFLRVLKYYTQYLKNIAITGLEDVCYQDNLLESKEELRRLMKEEYHIFPLFKSLEKIRQRLHYLLQPYEKEMVERLAKEIMEEDAFIKPREAKFRAEKLTEKEFLPLKTSIESMTSLDIHQSYANLFKDSQLFRSLCSDDIPKDFDEIREYTLGELNKGYVTYEDWVALLYLKVALDSPINTSIIKHIIIDEAQDYTPIQFEILKTIFKGSKMTILGDINQVVNGYMNVGSYEYIADTFKDNKCTLINLSKSYRSTKEITDFCREILPQQDNVEYLNRRGDKPQLIRVQSEELIQRISKDINSLQEKGHNLIAVICKTINESKSIHKALGQYLDLNLIMNESDLYPKGVIVIPAYLAKGLEFDAVLICSVDKEQYSQPGEEKLLYTACTRSLHSLQLYYTKELSPFIASINPELYIDRG